LRCVCVWSLIVDAFAITSTAIGNPSTVARLWRLSAQRHAFQWPSRVSDAAARIPALVYYEDLPSRRRR